MASEVSPILNNNFEEWRVVNKNLNVRAKRAMQKGKDVC